MISSRFSGVSRRHFDQN